MVTEKDRVTDDLQKYIKKSQWDRAIQALDRLTELEPNNAVHRLRAGDYYLKLGAPQKAVTAYHQAADVFIKGGFVVKALAAYKMILLRLDPQNKNAHEKMQSLHGQARQQAALSQPYIITAEPPPERTAAPLNRESDAVEESREAVSEAPSTEQDALDEGVIGVQPFNLEEFGSGTKPPAAENFSPASGIGKRHPCQRIAPCRTCRRCGPDLQNHRIPFRIFKNPPLDSICQIRDSPVYQRVYG